MLVLFLLRFSRGDKQNVSYRRSLGALITTEGWPANNYMYEPKVYEGRSTWPNELGPRRKDRQPPDTKERQPPWYEGTSAARNELKTHQLHASKEELSALRYEKKDRQSLDTCYE